MQKDAAYWIQHLQLTRHIEGGYYREVYKSPLIITQNNLPASFNGDRHISTSIYFLLEAGQFSSLHRIASDEVWHFYAGDPLVVYELEKDGGVVEHRLGSFPERDEKFQCVVKSGHWFGAKLAPGGSYALVGCTVSPGFDFLEFELAEREALIKLYPHHSELIKMLTIS
jgi:predicted cupin superfamily sugar epimerase